MNFKLFLLLALAASGLGQTGFYGHITNRVKAGDTAPKITFTSVLSSPTSAALNELNFSSDLTVLVFSPDTSHNTESVTGMEWLGGQVCEQSNHIHLGHQRRRLNFDAVAQPAWHAGLGVV